MKIFRIRARPFTPRSFSLVSIYHLILVTALGINVWIVEFVQTSTDVQGGRRGGQMRIDQHLITRASSFHTTGLETQHLSPLDRFLHLLSALRSFKMQIRHEHADIACRVMASLRIPAEARKNDEESAVVFLLAPMVTCFPPSVLGVPGLLPNLLGFFCLFFFPGAPPLLSSCEWESIGQVCCWVPLAFER